MTEVNPEEPNMALWRRMDPALNELFEKGLDITRENYINEAWDGDPPEDWTHEHEAQIPSFLR